MHDGPAVYEFYPGTHLKTCLLTGYRKQLKHNCKRKSSIFLTMLTPYLISSMTNKQPLKLDIHHSQAGWSWSLRKVLRLHKTLA